MQCHTEFCVGMLLDATPELAAGFLEMTPANTIKSDSDTKINQYTEILKNS